jgi:circadian clock protein KaiC
LTTPNDPAAIRKIATHVPGLDEVLGGGLPEYSFTLIAGDPGTGKTTLANQIMFAVATTERPAVHFTVLGEPPAKMLRYQQQFPFFDIDAVNDRVHFVNLSEAALTGDLEAVLSAITREVERLNPAVVVVDSFRTVIRAAGRDVDSLSLQVFVQRLALHLATWQTTSFLVGEYSPDEQRDNPVFTIADGIIWLTQSAQRNSVVRKLQVVKLRGQGPLPGLHTMRIADDGIQVFPRIIRRGPEVIRRRPLERLSLGIAELDNMMDGGLPVRDSLLVAGPAGSGKSALGTSFIGAGLHAGERSVIAVFEERPQEYVERATSMGPDFAASMEDGRLEVLYLRPLDLSVDEALLEIQSAVERLGAKRLLIDSLSGFELALAPTFREDFRESLYRMVGVLTGSGVTILMTAEIPTSFTDLAFSPSLVSFLADDIILQRYVELEGELRRMLTIVKMRGSGHSKELRLYEVEANGIVIGDSLRGYEGVITGVAHRL